MEELSDAIEALTAKGWTMSAIADELGVERKAISRWRAGTNAPANYKVMLAAVRQLDRRKRIPKRRRVPKQRQRKR